MTGPQNRSPSLPVGALSWKERENSDVSVCEERWSAVKCLAGEMENLTPERLRKRHSVTEIYPCMIRMFRPSKKVIPVIHVLLRGGFISDG